MEIKYWNKEKEQYEIDDKNLYFVNNDGMVVRHVAIGEIRRCSKIEPHFYINGGRVA